MMIEANTLLGMQHLHQGDKESTSCASPEPLPQCSFHSQSCEAVTGLWPERSHTAEPGLIIHFGQSQTNSQAKLWSHQAPRLMLHQRSDRTGQRMVTLLQCPSSRSCPMAGVWGHIKLLCLCSSISKVWLGRHISCRQWDQPRAGHPSWRV